MGGTSSRQGKRKSRLTEGFTNLGMGLGMGLGEGKGIGLGMGKGVGMGQGGSNAVVTGGSGKSGGGTGGGAVSRLARRHSLEVMQGVDSLRGAQRRRAYIWGKALRS